MEQYANRRHWYLLGFANKWSAYYRSTMFLQLICMVFVLYFLSLPSFCFTVMPNVKKPSHTCTQYPDKDNMGSGDAATTLEVSDIEKYKFL